MPRISVIVPVYNTEKYLHRCIDSILAQTYTDFELLLIDDGSTDSSGAICDEYALKDSRVRVFHKANGGVSSARNMGLDNAQGEWITFVDSDDWVKIDYFKLMIRQSDADLIMSSFEITDSTSKWNNCIENNKYGIEQISLFLNKYILSTQFCVPWCKLYKRNLIQENTELRFNTGISLAEDTIFVFGYLCRIKSVRTIEDFSYQYNRGVVDSLSVKYRTIDEYRKIIKENYDSLRRVEIKFNYDGDEVRFTRTLVIFRLCLDVIKNDKASIKKKYNHFIELLNDTPVRELLMYKNPKEKGPRRRFFDILALTRCYRFLFLYVICKKGFIY